MRSQHLNRTTVSAIKRSNQPIHTFFSHFNGSFCSLVYIEGKMQEGKVHEDLILSKMAETFGSFILFFHFPNLPVLCISVPLCFSPSSEQRILLAFCLYFLESVIPTLSFCSPFKNIGILADSTPSDGFCTLCIFADISGCCFLTCLVPILCIFCPMGPRKSLVLHLGRNFPP